MLSRAYWLVPLWALLVLDSAVLVLVPTIPLAGPNPLLAVAVGTLAGAVGLALLQLGVLRFLVFGGPIDLFAGMAFGVLGLANLAIGVAGPVLGVEPALEVRLSLLLASRTAAGLLLLVGLRRAGASVAPADRRGFAVRVIGLGGLAIAAVAAVLLGLNGRLPQPLETSVRAQLDNGMLVFVLLPGQARWLLAANGLLAALFLVAALGLTALARRTRDPHLGVLAMAVTLQFFAQLHNLPFPPIDSRYVSAADGFRLLSYLFLLFSLVSRIGGEIAGRSALEERQRLSRELHDGLAQQLGLLNLRLARAMAPDRPADRRAGDLDAAKRLVEASLLEARGAITALRTGTVTWPELARTLDTFADEFAQNHEIEVEVTTEGATGALPSEVQIELLRLLHEAFSNAVRHGGATEIDVAVVAARDRLRIEVRDNGAGFDPARTVDGGGIGLRSLQERMSRRGGALQIVSAPGSGASVRAELPLRRAEMAA